MKPVRKFSYVACLTLTLFIAGCFGGAQDSSAGIPDILEGKYLFSLPDLDGKEISLGDALKENKAVLINFWATWCPPCQEEIPDLIEMYAENKERGLLILGVDVAESRTKVANFAKRYEMNFPVLLDKDMAVTNLYRVVGIPTTILVNSEGKVLGVYHAFTEELVSDVEKALA